MVRRTVGLMLLWAAGCQGQTVGDSGTGGAAGLPGGTGGTGGTGSGGAGSGGASTGGASTGGAGGAQTGPGPHGALPTGYCCTTDEDCRYRACLEFGGVKVCSDRCMSNAACATGPGFVCSKATEQCEPGGTPSCIPGDQWKLGAQPIGACCVATGDGTAGEECQGNLCMAFGPTSNPFICTQACDTPKDCPANYKCETQVGFCWPYATDYTCQ